jgi:hypothetical protein
MALRDTWLMGLTDAETGDNNSRAVDVTLAPFISIEIPS